MSEATDQVAVDTPNEEPSGETSELSHDEPVEPMEAHVKKKRVSRKKKFKNTRPKCRD